MAVVTTDALILQAFAYTETSRILRLLTHEHGVQSVIAKGARRPRSQFGGILEPFTVGTATFQMRDNRDLHTLSGFDLLHAGTRLGGDLLRFGGASLLAEIVLRTGIEQPDPELFQVVRAQLLRLEDAPAAEIEAVVLAAAWQLIAQLGFAPGLLECCSCGRELAEGEDTSFDHAAGAARCMSCAPGSPGKPLPASARAALASMALGEAPQLQRTVAHWRLLSRFLTHHVVDGAPLQSLTFIAEALPDDAT
jgi:DNA repair protein RecO (recombination protein O)